MNKFRIILAALVVSVFTLGACTAPRTASDSGPTAAQWRSAVRGQWVLRSIDKEDFPENYTVKTVFEEAPPECFIGSIWVFPNNGNGTINFEADGRLCAPGAVRNIVWSIYNPGRDMGQPQFQFKKIYPGDRPANVTAGYRMNLSFADASNLVMRMPLNLDGTQGALVFNFERY